jgi:hypothetical protein
MNLITGQEGQLHKLTITICNAQKPFTPKQGEEFVYSAMANPEEIKHSFKTDYNQKQANGTSAANLVLRRQPPVGVNITLLFDGTGVFANDRATGSNLLSNIKPVSVKDQLKKFLSVVYKFDSDLHQPNIVQIKQGDLTVLATGKLTSLDITYNLFKPTGEPLRAKVACAFVSSISEEERLRQELLQSPDLTRIRVAKDGDLLPLLCYEIYGHSKYYLEVARVNKLKNFRTLTAGEKIFFPPLDKTSV